MKTAENKGIDYGLGRTNISKSGIRYGVIPQNEVLQAWADSSEPNYGDPNCPKCGNEAIDYSTARQTLRDDIDSWDHAKHECADYACLSCKYVFGSESAYGDEPRAWTYESEGYSASQGQDGDIFILDSPYFTYAQFCSPCAPGACYLLNPLETRDDNNRAFCFGHDWFEDGRAPYPVYSVKTGQLVEPETAHATQRRD